jgi:hypothetical protein
MNRTFRLFAVLAAACAAWLPTAMTVHAADGDVDTVAFAGNVAGNPVLLVGGAGDFAYQGTACETVSSDGEFGACVLNAAGVYINIVCGTGTAVGNANVVEGPDAQGDAFPFTITFVAGIGVVTGGASGVVVVVPNQPGSPPVCANAFVIVGALVLS